MTSCATAYIEQRVWSSTNSYATAHGKQIQRSQNFNVQIACPPQQEEITNQADLKNASAWLLISQTNSLNKPLSVCGSATERMHHSSTLNDWLKHTIH